MLTGGSSIGTTPFASPGGVFAGTESPLYARLLAGTSLDIVLLFEAQVMDRVTEALVPVRGLWSNARGKTWRGLGDDAEFFPELLMQPALVRSLLFGGAPLSGEGGDASAQFGVIELAQDQDNPLLAFWDRWSWEGSPWTLKIGGIGEGFSTFEPIARGQVSEASWDIERILLTVAEPAEPLLQPIQTNAYTGAGGLDGDENLKDRLKPLLFGRVFNRKPVLIDAANLVFQVHEGPISSLQLYDGGSVFTAAGPTLVSDVYAWDPVPGAWALDKAHGIFRPGNDASIAFTFDCDGDASGSGFALYLADVVRRMVVQRTTLTDTDLDGLAALGVACPYEVGIYLEDGSGTTQEALRSILSPLGCYATFRSNGLLFFDQLAPAGPLLTLADDDIEPPRRARGVRAITSLRLRYQEIQPQGDTQITTGLYLLDPGRKAFLAQQWREVLNQHTSVRRRTRSVVVETALQKAGDATREAARQADLAESLCDVYEVTVNRVIFALDVGQTVRITYPNFGFQSGRDCVVIGVTPNVSAGTMTLLLWT